MRAWQTCGDGRLRQVRVPVRRPADTELLVRVEACGVCRTDLHVIAGELPPHRSPVVPGHEIVGTVVEVVGDTGGIAVGDRVGVPWLRRTCGTCRWCRHGAENLCRDSRYTGWDADGGYAEYAAAPAAYVYPVPASLDPVQAAPLLWPGSSATAPCDAPASPRAGASACSGSGRART